MICAAAADDDDAAADENDAVDLLAITDTAGITCRVAFPIPTPPPRASVVRITDD